MVEPTTYFWQALCCPMSPTGHIATSLQRSYSLYCLLSPFAKAPQLSLRSSLGFSITSIYYMPSTTLPSEDKYYPFLFLPLFQRCHKFGSEFLARRLVTFSLFYHLQKAPLTANLSDRYTQTTLGSIASKVKANFQPFSKLATIMVHVPTLIERVVNDIPTLL